MLGDIGSRAVQVYISLRFIPLSNATQKPLVVSQTLRSTVIMSAITANESLLAKPMLLGAWVSVGGTANNEGLLLQHQHRHLLHRV